MTDGETSAISDSTSTGRVKSTVRTSSQAAGRYGRLGGTMRRGDNATVVADKTFYHWPADQSERPGDEYRVATHKAAIHSCSYGSDSARVRISGTRTSTSTSRPLQWRSRY